MTPNEARFTEPPEDFICDGCTMFPDRLLTWRGWVNLFPACLWHDWHYHLLRSFRTIWNREEFNEFKEWADLAFKMRLIFRLEKKTGRRVAIFIARRMWWAVDTFGGKALA